MKLMKPVCAVVFDLDGTLVDTFALSLQTTQRVLRQFFPHPVSDAEVIPLYGIPLPEIMARYVPDQVEAMVQAFEAYYLEHQEALVRPFSGVVETLNILKDWGYPLGILSNKRKEPGLREMRICGLEGLFRSALFLEDLEAPKPAAAALKQSAGSLGVAPTDVLYVGDSALDILCAQQAGATSAAALWPGREGPTQLLGDRERLLAQGPDYALGSVEELVDLCRPRGKSYNKQEIR